MMLRTLRPIVRQGIRAVDRRIGRFGGKRTVLVQARTPMNLAVLRPVFEPLLADPRLRVLFTGTAGQQAFAEYGLTDRVIPAARAAWTYVDLYMNADPWEAVTLWRVERQLNFFHGVAGKYDLDCPTGLPLAFDRYDRVAFPNASRQRAYVAAGIVAPERAVLVGFPKVDVLLTDRRGPRQRAAALGLDANKPTVIFAPTFSPESALHVAGEAIIETLLGCGCNVIVKLHDRSFDPNPRYSGGIDWRARLARHNGPSFQLATSGDSTPYVLASDVMVTDHSSIGFEYCVLDRPVIVFDAPELASAARINHEKIELLRSAAAVASTLPGLAAAVAEALSNPGALSAQRRRVVEEVFYQAGTATARALQLVYDLLDLAPAIPDLPAEASAA